MPEATAAEVVQVQSVVMVVGCSGGGGNAAAAAKANLFGRQEASTISRLSQMAPTSRRSHGFAQTTALKLRFHLIGLDNKEIKLESDGQITEVPLRLLASSIVLVKQLELVGAVVGKLARWLPPP